MTNPWTPLDGVPQGWIRDGGDGHRWEIRPSDTTPDHVALFRLASEQPFPTEAGASYSSIDEDYALGVFRSPAEAKVAAGLLAAPGDLAKAEADLKDLGFEYRGEHTRRAWKIHLPEGYVSLYLGGDEDRRDVVCILQVAGERVTRLPLLISHGKGSLHPHPTEGASLQAAASFIRILHESNHMLVPLGEDDWLAHAAGREIPVRERGPVTRAEAMSLAMSIMGMATRNVDDTNRIARGLGDFLKVGPSPLLDEDVAHIVGRALEEEPAERVAQMAAMANAHPETQYIIAASILGVEAVEERLAAAPKLH